MVVVAVAKDVWRVPKDVKTNDDGKFIDQIRRYPQAFAQLYRLHFDRIFRYCVHRLFNRTAAEDVTSTVFMKVVENLSRFRGDEKDFSCWLYQIATNTINSYLRDSLRKKTLLDNFALQQSVQGNDCESPCHHAEKMLLLHQAMLTLKPKHQAAITLRYFERKNYSDIAVILGASEATIRSQLSRALRKLRKHITKAEKNA